MHVMLMNDRLERILKEAKEHSLTDEEIIRRIKQRR
jgi:hypothetical protein